jgi:RHS repeat-associated protein
MMKKVLYVALALLGSFRASAQNLGTGAYPFASLDNKGFDSINLGNLNVQFAIPIVSRQGRGLPFNYVLEYEGLIWSPQHGAWVNDSAWGFNGVLNGTSFSGYITDNETTGDDCPVVNGRQPPSRRLFTNYVYHDPYGAAHNINYSRELPCVGSNTGVTITGDGSTRDGSGYTLVNGITIENRSGSIITPGTSATGQDITNITDTNGNVISKSVSGTFTDTLGVSALTVSGVGPVSFTYPVTLQSDGASTASATLTYQTYTVRTNFQCPNISDFGSLSVSLVNRITLADGSFYAFTYEPTPGATDGAVTARLASVTLPTQGTISYSYSGGCNGSGITADGTPSGLTRTTTDGTKSYARATVNANATSTTTQDEQGNVSVYQFTSPGSSQFFETHRQIYQGSNTSGGTLLDQYTCYNGASAPCDGQPFTLPILQANVLLSYNNGTQSLTSNTYNSSGLLTGTTQSFAGTTLESTAMTYNSLGEVLTSVTTDGAKNTLASSSYGYDEATPTTTSGIPQHVAAAAARGNQTSAHVSTGSSALTTTTAYYDTGIPVSTTTPNGTTQYSYDSTQTFATTTTLPTPSSGVALATSASYDQQSGAALSATGMNAGQTTQVNQYDRLLRPTSITQPNGGTTTYVYSPTQTGVKPSLGSGITGDTETLYDGYGRMSRVAVANGSAANPWYQTDYCYNSLGQLQFRSAQYAGTGWPTPKQCSGAGDTYSYDALGRVTKIAHADGSSDSKSYNGRAAFVTSSSGVSKIIQSDGLGRISAICEISSNASMPNSGAPTPCGMDIAGTGFLTTYAYDLANHKTTITQGAQTRIFQTDGIGRTISVQEPESGTTTYSYSYNTIGLVVTRTRPKANQTSSTVLTTTTTQYDTLGRVASISYTDGTPAKNFYYDQATNWGPVNLGSSKGQLTYAASANSAGMQFAYDQMGNVTNTIQCDPDWCGNPGHDIWQWYGYDLAGEMTSEQYGRSGTVIATLSYGYNLAGQLNSMTGGQNNATNAPAIFSASSLGPSGPITVQFGNGLQGPYQYDGEGRQSGGWVCAGSSQPYCPSGNQLYGFLVSFVGNNATALTDTILNRASSFGYDDFGRLNRVAPIAAQNVLNMNFTYDRYGNRLVQSVSNGGAPEPQPSFSVNAANNQVVGNSYDAAGNVLSDGVHSYQYDAENNVISVDNGATATYVYDALNHRVKVVANGVTERYGFDIAGRRSTNWQNNSTNLDQAQYYAGSQPVAYWAAFDGNIHFVHQDWLGTVRLHTSFNGSVESAFTSLPFGDALTSSGVDNNETHFAKLDHDFETSSEHATFRQYSSTQGRWFSPDPYSGSYNFRNPQSLNRYAYVLSKPLTFIDPQGQAICLDVDQSETPNSDGSDGVTYNYGTECFLDSGGGGGGGGYIGGGGGGGGGAGSGTAPSSAACPPSCGFTMKVNVSTTAPPAIAQEAIPLEIPWPTIPWLPPWLTQDPTQTLMKSMKWSKYPACSVQYQNDIAVCQNRKTSSCWSSAAERLAHCNATGGSVGWPPLSN